jgi:hypothetical protein
LIVSAGYPDLCSRVGILCSPVQDGEDDGGLHEPGDLG